MSRIHQSAIVHEGVKLGENVTVEAYAVINSPNVILGDNVTIKSHVVIEGDVTIGDGTTVWPFACIGTEPQHLIDQGDDTSIEIGKNCRIREYVTINLSIGKGSKVIVGDDCVLMAYSHVAHNCTLGKGVIMTNGSTIAGHVEIGNYAILGGLCAIHQYNRIGDYAMVGGGSMVGHDLPPFCLGIGYPLKVSGLNMVGLKRRKFTFEQRRQIIKAYRITFNENLAWTEAKKKIEQEIEMTDDIKKWIDFCDHSKRGLVTARQKTAKGKKEIAQYAEG